MQVTVPAGEERTFCQYFTTPAAATKVNRLEHAYTDVSHHLLVYATGLSASQVDTTAAFDCDGGVDIQKIVTGAYYGSQVAEDEIAFPPDVALELPASQVIMMEYHAINAGAADVAADVRVNAWFPEQATTKEAGTLLFFHDDIMLSPGATETAGMRCGIPDDIEVAFAIPHMHLRGRGFRSWVEDGGAGTPLAEASDWVDPPTAHFDPAVHIAAGSRIRVECDFENTSSEVVQDGFSAVKDEMCVLFAGYYRTSGDRLSFGDELCIGPGSGPTYSGSTACRPTYDCDNLTWWGPDPGSLDAEVARHECRAASCDASYDAFIALTRCVDKNCQSTCWSGQSCAEPDCPECLACMSASCAEESSACDAATCGG